MRSLLFIALLLVSSLSQAAAPAGHKVSDLVAVLKSDASQKAKADACRELARTGTSEAVAALAALLPDEQLSHMARYALETIPGSTADKALRDGLSKLSGRPLIGVIGSVGVRRDSGAVPALAKLLTSDDPGVAGAAGRALGSIGTKAAAKSLTAALGSASTEQQRAICEGLLRCAERFAADGSKQAALNIYDRLRTLPQPHQVRTAAWRGSILLRGQDGLPLLLKAIRSDDFSLFVSATRIAREMPGSAVTHALATELTQLPTDNQVVLVQMLGQRGDPAAMPALFAAAAHHDKGVCLAGIAALASMATKAGPSPAVASSRQQEAARDALTAPMIPVLMGLMFHSDHDIAQAAQNALAALPGQATDDAILGMLAPGNSLSHRLKGLDLIARRRLTSALPQLFSLARGPDPVLRLAAIKKLGELADPSSLPDLHELLTTAQSPEDMGAAEQSLAAVSLRAPNPEVWAAKLAGGWESSPAAQKCSLVRVFAAIGGTNALRTVRLAATDPNIEVRSAALRALGSWSNGEASGDLLELARSASDPSDRALALRSFLEVAAQSELPAAKRQAMCRDAAPLVKSDDQKKMLLSALGALRTPEALRLIRPLLEESALKEEACAAAVNVSEKILQGSNASRSAGQVVEVLEQVTRLEPQTEVQKRAQTLLEGARSKSHGT